MTITSTHQIVGLVAEYRTPEHRGEWPPGPWDGEPDKVVWVDPETGLDAMVVRNRMGAWCGYVGVPPEHPWHGKAYSQCLAPGCSGYSDDGHDWETHRHVDVDVHGGLTYSEACREGASEAGGICHVPQDGRPDHVWWFGFDCCHGMDSTPIGIAHGIDDISARYGGPAAVYRDLGYVHAEVTSLASQLAAVTA